MIVKLLTEHHLEFLSSKGGCRGSSESTLVKMSNCWKSHSGALNLLWGSSEMNVYFTPSIHTVYEKMNAVFETRLILRDALKLNVSRTKLN